ncbi:elongation factor P [Avrilella dinanensis]|uniref:Elongation factor P n=1 Tax=Avrilella dinanensis TaxID=2008672 RepID=A0A2M9R6H8_9FLAO|nr:elongation factor P [Avrilella dinanensis]PJR04454.1 elongation factor P [Avrilella dinanensis]
MATTSDIRNGLCIKYNNDIYKIVEFLHVKPGKGPAFVRTKMRSVTTGRILENTFSAGHKIEDVRVETHTFQYLYPEGNDFHFMNTETFEQITLDRNALDAPDLLKEGTNVMVQINTETDTPLSVDMPASVVLQVTYAEPGVKGNTATNATKPATVETGASVNVPLFIEEGDKIKIDTTSGNYIERVKE